MTGEPLPRAHLSHHAHGRTRIRIPSRKGDRDFFERLGKLVSTWEAIETFELNPVLGTLLLLHEADLPRLRQFFASNRLFEIQPPETSPAEPLARRLGRSLGDLDGDIQRSTGGSADLASVAFVGLVGLGTLQLLRSQALPPAVTLFQMAIATLNSKDRKG